MVFATVYVLIVTGAGGAANLGTFPTAEACEKVRFRQQAIFSAHVNQYGLVENTVRCEEEQVVDQCPQPVVQPVVQRRAPTKTPAKEESWWDRLWK